jgi:8-oxo-dGTP pyrophosphatase MutT (NUDIX family)
MAEKDVGAAAAIFDGQGRILLVKHNYGPRNWELPGGRVEPGESPLEAVIREVQEETGLKAAIVRLSAVYHRRYGDSLQFVFIAEAPDAEPRPGPDEIDDCGYFAVDGLPRPMSNFTLQRITDAAAGSGDAAVVTVEESLRWLE